MKNELEISNDFYQLRAISQSIQDLSLRLHKLEEGHYLNEISPTDQLWFVHTYIAVRLDLEEMVKKLDLFYKKYGDGKTNK